MVCVEILYNDDTEQMYIAKSCIEQNGFLKLNNIKYEDNPNNTVYIPLGSTAVKSIRVSHWSEADDARETDIRRQLTGHSFTAWNWSDEMDLYEPEEDKLNEQ